MRSRDHDVVLVRRTIKTGEALRGWEFEMGREFSSRATWDQGGQDSTTQKEGFQVSKREFARGISKGLHLHLILLICVYIYHITV
jgi:hypothetical protein